MKKVVIDLILAFFFLALSAFAFDPSPLQDFCVAIVNDTCMNGVFVNGQLCKNPKLVTAEDFTFSGLNIPGNTSNAVGSAINLVNVEKLPGLNSLGIAMSRIDYAPNGGLNPPHFHPRAAEVLLVQEGKLYAGFITSFPEYRLITRVLNKGDLFAYPVGLIHFQINLGKTKAVAIAAFSSQNPGLFRVPNAIFGSNPLIDPDILAKAFKLDKSVVKDLQSKFHA